MSLLPRKKEKKVCHLGNFGAPQMFPWMCFFPPCPIQTTCDESKEGHADLCCESATVDNMWLSNTPNTSSYSRKANTAEHRPIIFAGLQTSLECPWDLWPEFPRLMVKQKLLTFQSKSVSHTHAPMSPFISVSAQASFNRLINNGYSCYRAGDYSRKVIYFLYCHAADNSLSNSVSVFAIISLKCVD